MVQNFYKQRNEERKKENHRVEAYAYLMLWDVHPVTLFGEGYEF